MIKWNTCYALRVGVGRGKRSRSSVGSVQLDVRPLGGCKLPRGGLDTGQQRLFLFANGFAQLAAFLCAHSRDGFRRRVQYLWEHEVWDPHIGCGGHLRGWGKRVGPGARRGLDSYAGYVMAAHFDQDGARCGGQFRRSQVRRSECGTALSTAVGRATDRGKSSGAVCGVGDGVGSRNVRRSRRSRSSG